MSIPTTREPNHNKVEQSLFLALELSDSNWKLAFTGEEIGTSNVSG